RDLWSVLYEIDGGCSDDGFIDFRAWLVMQGQDVLETVLAAPDYLGEITLEDCAMSYEPFNYMDRYAYRRRTGEEEVPDWWPPGWWTPAARTASSSTTAAPGRATPAPAGWSTSSRAAAERDRTWTARRTGGWSNRPGPRTTTPSGTTWLYSDSWPNCPRRRSP